MLAVIGVPAALAMLAVLLLTVDLPVARFCEAEQYPKEISEVLDNVEPFGHGIGVAFVVITLFVLDPARRSWAPALCATSAVAGGLAANLVKMLLGRTRPRNLDLQATQSIWETFQGAFPLGTGGSALQSFPSAHTATAMAFAVALSVAYPRGRWWFYTLAALVGMHRVEVTAHYPSDVCAGAILGWLAGQGCLAIARRMAARKLQTQLPSLAMKSAA